MDSYEPLLNKKIIYWLIAIFLILFGTFLFRRILLGPGMLVGLPKTSLMSGVVSQNLITTGGKISLPIEGSNYSITSVQYFSHGEWAVLSLRPLNNSSISGVVLLEKQNNYYTVVMGPGTSFDINYFVSLPSAIKQYFVTQGLTYEPVYR